MSNLNTNDVEIIFKLFKLQFNKNNIKKKNKRINNNTGYIYLPYIDNYVSIFNNQEKYINLVSNNFKRDDLRNILILNNLSYHNQIKADNKMLSKEDMIKKLIKWFLLNMYKKKIEYIHSYKLNIDNKKK